MPRKAKEKEESKEEKNIKKEPSSKKSANKKEPSKTEKKKTPSKKVVVKTNTSKAKVPTTKTKTAVKRNSSKKSTSPKEKIEILEYYDLPYRYNQTIVRILAQTPNTLFIYWDIADEDRKKYTEQYGEHFFHDTKPVLVVHNKTKNNWFEVDINDFANSWYLHVEDSNCDYQIQLGRRPINEHVQMENNYLNITTSNDIQLPNDHILFDELSHFVYFRNVKSNQSYKKDITNLSLLNKMGKFASIKEFYQKLYKDEKISFDKVDLRNPSSN